MRLAELRRTTGAQAVLLLLAAFGTASVAIFLVIYLRSTDFLVERINEWLRYESAQMADLPPLDLQAAVSRHDTADITHRWQMTLFGPGGDLLAGDAQPPPPSSVVPGKPFGYTIGHGGRTTPMRGIVTRLRTGDRLLIGERLNWVGLLARSALRGLLLGAVVVALLGLLVAAGFGLASLRRLNAMRVATQAIVRGDLSRRLPEGVSRTDLGRMARLVNEMLDEIERLMREVQAVSDGIAHDLRTPLTRLLGALERTGRRATTVEAYAAGLQEATDEVHRLLSMLQGLLRLSEIEHDHRRAGFTEIDLRETVQGVVDLMEPMAEEKGILLTSVCPPSGLVTLKGDPSLMFEALMNLVDNAIKFTPPGGEITVGVMAGKRPGLQVVDSGPGIPPAEREAVLKRFYRTERSRHTGGNGLGLSMVKAIADLHRMRVFIKDGEPGCVIELVQAVEGSAAPVA